MTADTDGPVVPVTPFLSIPVEPGALQWRQWLLSSLLVCVAYAATGFGGLQLAFVGQAVTLFWPPSGIAFAALWLGGRRMAPAVITGAFVVNLWVFHATLPALIVAVGNLLPALCSVPWVRGVILKRGDPGELPRAISFILIAALASTMLSATVGTTVVHTLGHAQGEVQSTWLVWWMGDAMGVLIIAPPILLWRRLLVQRPGVRDALDVLFFAFLGVCVIAALMFIRNPIWAVELCKLFTLLVSLWTGARFGLTGPAVMTLFMSFGALGVTVMGVGPFVRGDFYDRFAQVHSYLFAEAVAGMLLAAALSDLRRALTRERLARNQAEVASTNRIRLLNMISHDVRTPLSGMLGSLQVLQAAALPEAQRASLTLGLRAGRHLTQLVDDMLDVARVDSGRLKIMPAPFQIRQCLQDVILLNQPEAAARQLGLHLEVPGRLPTLLVGDRVRFTQVLGNLVANAIRYTVQGAVTVHVHWDSVADRLHLEVRDTGPGLLFDRLLAVTADLQEGIPLDILLRHAVLTQSSGGLGLGLQICVQLVALMDGRITYQQMPAGGSVFHCTLPMPEAIPGEDVVQAPLSSCVSPGPNPVPRLQVLLVEDDAIVRETTAALLTAAGVQVQVAADGAEALSLLAAAAFDVVLIDLDLGYGKPDGWTTLQHLRALPGAAGQVKVIALTGQLPEADVPQAAGCHFDGMLQKPLRVTAALLGMLTEPALRPLPVASRQ